MTIRVEPDPVLQGEEATITISGRAYGGRHLEAVQLDYGNGFASSRQAGCVASPVHEPAVEDESFTVREMYVWDKPGTYTLKITLSALCRSDIPTVAAVAEVDVR